MDFKVFKCIGCTLCKWKPKGKIGTEPYKFVKSVLLSEKAFVNVGTPFANWKNLWSLVPQISPYFFIYSYVWKKLAGVRFCSYTLAW